jgi:hypothetical protein
MASHAVLEACEALWRTIGAEDQLLARLVEGVEGVEELLEDLFLALQELDVVEEEDVHAPIPRLELVHLAATDAVDEVVEEVLRRDVPHLELGVHGSGLEDDGLEEVGLPQAGAAVDEERVVLVPRLLGDRHRRRVREPVRWSDDEGLEAVAADGVLRLGSLVLRLGWRCELVVAVVLDVFERGGAMGLHDETDVGSEHLARGLLDEGPVLVVHPAEVELAGDREMDHVAVECLRTQVLEPGLPRDRGHPVAQPVPEPIPGLSLRMRLQRDSSVRSDPYHFTFSTGMSTPVENQGTGIPLSAPLAPRRRPSGSGSVHRNHPAGGECMERPNTVATVGKPSLEAARTHPLSARTPL